jgi:pyruvate dehydrogenase E2 component (dihydrolipoamide acetyltransferase)
MSESVNLPALGESVTEGTVTRWLKNVGDRVEVDEPLLEVSTDKVDTEIPSPIAGVIEAILVQEDETVEVGTPLVTIGDGSAAAEPEAAAPEAAAPEAAAPAAPAAAPEAAAPAAPAEQEPAGYASPTPEAEAAPAASAPAEVPSTDAPAPAEAPAAVAPPAPAAVEQPPAPAAPAPAAPSPMPAAPAAPAAPVAAAPAEPSRGAHAGTSGYVTPIVRKLANEAGVDLSTITGTGVGGRIRKQDILAAAPAQAGAAEPQAAEVEVSPLRGTTQPMSRLRKVVAERAVASMQQTAQLTTVVEVDVTRVAMLRDKVKVSFHEKTGNKLSFLPFFALAAAEALKSNPIINATVDGTSIVYPPQENMSIAVDTERGLLTPVIRDAGELDLAGFAAQIADLAARTRDNKLKPDELSGGTFTLTNTGSRGALFDTPVVFLPQSAILGTGVVYKKPIVVTDKGLDSIAIRSTVFLALSYDHRIIDGADASRFLTTMKARLEAGAFEPNLGI